MEFCGVFYETGYLRAVYDRIRKLFFVFLMAAVLTVGMMGQGMETINFGSVRLKDMAGRAVAEYAAGVGTTGSFMISVTEIQISADVSADLFTVPAVISERSEDLNTGNSAAVVLPVEDAISDALMAEETISIYRTFCLEKKPYRMLRSLRRFCQMIRRSAENCQTFR